MPPPSPKHNPRDQIFEWEFGFQRGASASAHARLLPTATHLQQAQCGPQGQPGSMAQHRAQCFPPRLRRGAGMGVASTAAWGATCCARSARPAGAERFPPCWRRARATAASAATSAAAALGGLRTREAAGTGSAPPFPRCHSDPRCLAPRPVRGLPQSKGNFLVSRQRNNAPAREGVPRSQRLRLLRGPEAGQATPAAAPEPRSPGPGVPSRSAETCLLLPPPRPYFHFSPLCGPQPCRLSRTQYSLPLTFQPPPLPLPPSTPNASPSLSSFLSSSSAFSRASFPRMKLNHSRFP